MIAWSDGTHTGQVTTARQRTAQLAFIRQPPKRSINLFPSSCDCPQGESFIMAPRGSSRQAVHESCIYQGYARSVRCSHRSPQPLNPATAPVHSPMPPTRSSYRRLTSENDQTQQITSEIQRLKERDQREWEREQQQKRQAHRTRNRRASAQREPSPSRAELEIDDLRLELRKHTYQVTAFLRRQAVQAQLLYAAQPSLPCLADDNHCAVRRGTSAASKTVVHRTPIPHCMRCLLGRHRRYRDRSCLTRYRP